jgi:hypothetical protein
MKLGTRSILFGAHCWFIHPWFVAVAWTKLYRFPYDPRLWVAFFVHDLGYIGMPNMDGIEGQRHPELGGQIMSWLFGKEWGEFTRFHSRYYARLENKPVSPLMAADKLAAFYTPAWLYVPMATLSGEIYEYMNMHGSLKAQQEGLYDGTPYGWYAWLQENFRKTALAGGGFMDPPLKDTP